MPISGRPRIGIREATLARHSVAGLKAGDVIVAFNGTAVTSEGALIDALA